MVFLKQVSDFGSKVIGKYDNFLKNVDFISRMIKNNPTQSIIIGTDFFT